MTNPSSRRKRGLFRTACLCATMLLVAACASAPKSATPYTSDDAELMLPSSAQVTDCEVTLTYTARWSWDLTIYLSYARLQIFNKGVAVGDAVYDSTRGGGNLSKFIDAEPKIRELVTQLLPPHGV